MKHIVSIYGKKVVCTPPYENLEKKNKTMTTMTRMAVTVSVGDILFHERQVTKRTRINGAIREGNAASDGVADPMNQR